MCVYVQTIVECVRADICADMSTALGQYSGCEMEMEKHVYLKYFLIKELQV